jgi:hypothetical protein
MASQGDQARAHFPSRTEEGGPGIGKRPRIGKTRARKARSFVDARRLAAMQVTLSNGSVNALRRMTVQQLLDLGVCQVVYLKAGISHGEQAFIIYAADGVPLDVVGSLQEAADAVAEHGQSFVTVH